jgi:hypothetical protein
MGIRTRGVIHPSALFSYKSLSRRAARRSMFDHIYIAEVVLHRTPTAGMLYRTKLPSKTKAVSAEAAVYVSIRGLVGLALRHSTACLGREACSGLRLRSTHRASTVRMGLLIVETCPNLAKGTAIAHMYTRIGSVLKYIRVGKHTRRMFFPVASTSKHPGGLTCGGPGD